MRLTATRFPLIVLVLSLSGLLSSPATADTLILHDGQKVDGTLIGVDSQELRFMTEEDVLRIYQVSEVRSLFFDRETSPATVRAPETEPAERSADTSQTIVVPAGARILVQMIDSIDSEVHEAGDAFRASLASDLTVDGTTVARKGADASVKLVHVEESGKLKGREQVSLELDTLTVENSKYDVTTSFTSIAGDAKGKESAKVIGGAAALGAIIGAIAGGGEGAAIGAGTGAGAGAAVQVLRGNKIQVPSESKLEFTLAEPLKVR